MWRLLDQQKFYLINMKISEVFTPKKTEPNLNTYIPRKEIEDSIFDAIDTGLNVVICGESGSGKSWLYKKVFHDKNISYKIVNCASTERYLNLTETIYKSIIPDGYKRKVSILETKKAEIGVSIAKGGLETTNGFQLNAGDPLYDSFLYLREHSVTEKFVLVFDNLEFIFSSEKLMKELGSIIMLLDDEIFSHLNIQILIVGVPSGILEYYSNIPNLQSISNRLEEVSKVRPLTSPMVQTLCIRGFSQSLKMISNIEDIKEISEHTYNLTLGLAQRVQEYFLKLAKIIEKNSNSYNQSLLEEADIEWMKSGLRQSYIAVSKFLVNGKIGPDRRNQVIYCIGKTKSHEFDYDEIEEKIKIFFPNTINGQKINYSQIFKSLSEGDRPLIKKSITKGNYLIYDSRYLMVIRAMLFIDQSDGSVGIKKFAQG